jgi:hypothetical protein
MGYKSTTIFRLWDPSKNVVKAVRDVSFNEADLNGAPKRPSQPKPTPAVIITRPKDFNPNDYKDAPPTPTPTPTPDPDSKTIERVLLTSSSSKKQDPDQPDIRIALAKNNPEAPQWHEAMQTELQKQLERGTYTAVEPPIGRKILTPKWVFKKKKDPEGRVIEHKARLVIRGYEQIPGLDYEQTYASVVRSETSRILLALAATRDWEIHQLDAVSAFLNSKADKDIYMQYPKDISMERTPGTVLKVNLALYGMKQSARLWADTAWDALKSIGFKRSMYDSSLFFRKEDTVYITTHVDDFKVMSPSLTAVENAKKQLMACFQMKDIGPISFYLGIRITRDRAKRTITLDQSHFIEKILNESGMDICKVDKTPMECKLDLQGAANEEAKVNQQSYVRNVGSLLHLAVNTRPDIAIAVSRLAGFNSNPSAQYWTALKRVLRYLQGSRHLSIIYGARPNPDTASEDTESFLKGYSDSD